MLVVFKINGKLNVAMPAVEIMKKLDSCVFVAKQGKSVIDVSKPDNRTIAAIHNPPLFEMTHEDIC